MKRFYIKYINLFATPNFANLDYLDCTIEGLDEGDAKKKFESSYKNGEMLMSIKEIK